MENGYPASDSIVRYQVINLLDLVIQIDDSHWFDEKRGAGRRLIVDHAREF